MGLGIQQDEDDIIVKSFKLREEKQLGGLRYG